MGTHQGCQDLAIGFIRKASNLVQRNPLSPELAPIPVFLALTNSDLHDEPLVSH